MLYQLCNLVISLDTCYVFFVETFDYVQEEQRVIDAKIRMRRKEIQDEEERMQRRQEMSSSSRIFEPTEIGYASGTGMPVITLITFF